MVTARELPRILLALLIGLSFGEGAYSQRPDNLPDVPATVVIDGAVNPELISQEAVFLSLSGLLESSGPRNCSSDTEITGFSEAGACLEIDGVDIAAAVRLIKDFRDQSREMSKSAHERFCGQQRARRVPYLSREEFAAEFKNFQDNNKSERANFFIERGNALLGREGTNRLIAWADANLRRGIREVDVDFVSLMESRDLTAEQFSESFCSRVRQ